MTVTVQVSSKFPSVVVTVMVAVPSATAVTLPFVSTVATPGALLSQVTDLSVALSGVIVGVYVPTDFDTKEKALSGAKTAEKGLK